MRKNTKPRSKRERLHPVDQLGIQFSRLTASELDELIARARAVRSVMKPKRQPPTVSTWKVGMGLDSDGQVVLGVRVGSATHAVDLMLTAKEARSLMCTLRAALADVEVCS
jgi:hypothetical protein